MSAGSGNLSAALTTRVVLVRHGQSVATVERVAGGELGCRGLTDLGRRQALALAERLRMTGELGVVRALLASTLPRAIETAELIAPALAGRRPTGGQDEMPVRTDRELCEWHPGEGDGLTWEEWEQRYGGFDPTVEPYRPLSPGGESWAEFQLRAGRALARVANDHAGGTVVVACHGGIVESSLLHGLLLPVQVPPAHRVETIPNTSLTEWVVDVTPGRAQHWRLIRFGDAAHLDGEGVPRPIRW